MYSQLAFVATSCFQINPHFGGSRISLRILRLGPAAPRESYKLSGGYREMEGPCGGTLPRTGGVRVAIPARLDPCVLPRGPVCEMPRRTSGNTLSAPFARAGDVEAKRRSWTGSG
jgi:hypothetical protein